MNKSARNIVTMIPHFEQLEDRTLLSVTMELLDPLSVAKFDNPLPDPAVIDATTGGRFNIQMRETEQWLGLRDPDGEPLMTRVWGYGQGNHPSYPGPTIEARSDVPIDIRWQNKLPSEHLLPVDTSIHLARPVREGIPTVTHLHGGHTESASDGLPEAWFTQNFKETGPHFVKRTYHYDNDQEAATLWYHDHALGITRLNVYAGLAGFYLLRDANEDALSLPRGAYEREIVIQDRIFTEEGQLFYPSDPEEESEHAEPVRIMSHGSEQDDAEIPEPSVVPEFFGDTIVVNGMAWPYLEVEPREYRLRLLNGSDSRFYVLQFGDEDPLEFLQIGTDAGLLDSPVPLTQLIIAPGERADLIVDFAGYENHDPIILRNFGPDEPFKGLGVGDSADPDTTGKIMQFRVNLPLDASVSFPDVDVSTDLRSVHGPLPSLVQDGPTRQLVLFEGEDEFGRLRPQLGTLGDGSLLWDDPITENPALNATEVWEIYNATEDAHPIHLHLVAFHVLSHQGFDGTVEVVDETDHTGGTKQVLTLNGLVGMPQDPAANEAGRKDTVQILPGQVTRIIATFDRPGRYVWHCHILSHEDHEMMRPYEVQGDSPSAILPPHAAVAAARASAARAMLNTMGAKTNASLPQVDPVAWQTSRYEPHRRLENNSADLMRSAAAFASEGMDSTPRNSTNEQFLKRAEILDGLFAALSPLWYMV